MADDQDKHKATSDKSKPGAPAQPAKPVGKKAKVGEGIALDESALASIQIIDNIPTKAKPASEAQEDPAAPEEPPSEQKAAAPPAPRAATSSVPPPPRAASAPPPPPRAASAPPPPPAHKPAVPPPVALPRQAAPSPPPPPDEAPQPDEPERKRDSLLDAEEMFSNLGITKIVKGSQPPPAEQPDEVIMTPDQPLPAAPAPAPAVPAIARSVPGPRPGHGGVYTLPMIDDDLEPPPAAMAAAAESPAQSSPPDAASAPPGPEVLDSRITEIEPLLNAGQWGAICDLLGTPEDAKLLPPTLQLVYGIARKEAMSDRITTSDTDALAIKAMARLAGVSDESPVALMLTKRALRSKRPWASQKASKPFTVIFLVLGLGVGLLAGWVYTYFFGS